MEDKENIKGSYSSKFNTALNNVNRIGLNPISQDADETVSGNSGETLDNVQRAFLERGGVHNDKRQLMQRYFAWSIYVLIVFWLSAMIMIVILSALNPIPSFIINPSITCVAGAIFGIIFGTIYAMSKYRNCSKDISLKKKMEQTEEYFINLLYKILLGIFIGGIGGIPIGVFFLDQKKYTFTIEPTVLIALITSTTASVLGIFICVMWWLFPRNVNKNADS